MKGLKILFMLFMYHNSFATTYYVSNAGSDAANGTTAGTAWQTISKVNAATFAANDSILFKCGDSWNERLVPNRSTLYFGSYSTGVKPLITGFQTATMAFVSGNVYESTVTPADSLNTVIINGKLGIKARFPNSGYLTYTGGTDSTLITSLTGTPSYVGKEIVIRVSHWIIDVSNVTAQSTGTLSLSTKLTYAVNTSTLGGNGYFFQNHVDFLDSTSEWTYSANSLKVYSTTTPTVQYSTIDTLVWVRQKSNIVFNGISFTGANKKAFQIDTCSRITVQNCTLNNNGRNGITAYKSHHVTINSDSIQNSLNAGIYLRRFDPYTPMQDTCNNATITNNYIKNSAIYAGMGSSNNERYMGIIVLSDSMNVSNNVIDSTGYIPIKWNGRWSLIKNNYITNFCLNKDDAGGIYTVIGSYVNSYFDTSSIIRGNIILNGIGATAGVNPAASFTGAAAGVYLDDDVYGYITIDSNTIYNTLLESINMRTCRRIIIRDNLFDDSTGIHVRSTGNSVQSNTITLKKNIFYQRNSSNQILNFGNTGTITALDSNYYLKTSLTNIIRYGGTDYTFPELWQSTTGFDTHSNILPNFRASGVGVLFTNPTSASVTTTLNAPYIDVYNNLYYQDITLPAYGSSLLFPSTLYITKTYTPH